MMPITLSDSDKNREERGKACLETSQSTIRNFRGRTWNRSRRLYGAGPRHRCRFSGPSWRSFSIRNPRSRTGRPPGAWVCTTSLCASGGNGGPPRAFPSTTSLARDAPGFFPPQLFTIVKAVACEQPAKHDQPLSRLFVPDIKRIVIAEGHVESISTSTIWRILDEAALKPWRMRSWIWSRDPLFYERAAPVLDLYQGLWMGRRLGPKDFVISADEKSSIQARIRLHESEVHADRRGQRVEHEYERAGAWTYLAALDVHRAKIFGRLEKSNGISPFHRLVAHVMKREPYASARRVFWIVDQGSSHRPTTFPKRLRNQFPNAVAVNLPVHASWLNQIEIYFSILQRKALTPNEFPSLEAVKERIFSFQKLFMRNAEPFNWNFTRHKLRKVLKRISSFGKVKKRAA